jgi:outer membrane lipoprotein
MERRGGLSALLVGSSLIIGCSSTPDVIPDALEPQVDRSVTYQELTASPESYRGRTVVLGGEVLKARRLREGTELEVLEVPLDKSHRPAGERINSRGRFIALDRNLPDPAAFPPGMPVTIVGEVTGATTQRVDEVEQRYPTVDVKHVHVWTDDPDMRRRAWGPSVGVGIGVGSGGYGRSGFGFGGISIGGGY